MLRDKARYVLDNLTTLEVWQKETNRKRWYIVKTHAVHPVTGVTFCSHGRRTKVGIHGTTVADINCKRCLKAIEYLKYVAERD